MSKRPRRSSLSLLGYCAALAVLLLSLLAAGTANWFNATFGVRIEEVLFTLRTPFKEADTSFLAGVLPYILPYLPLFCVIAFLLLTGRFVLLKNQDLQLCLRVKEKEVSVSLPLLLVWGLLFGSIVLLVSTCYAEYQRLEIPAYLDSLAHQTTIYEDYYVEPSDPVITPPAQKKNLLLIYLESMETTYASIEDGGHQPVSYIPELTALARENISFSDSSLLGGAHNPAGTGWTVASLFASSSGLPFRFPGMGNEMDQHQYFASGVTSLGDLLARQGYQQEFLCGSSGNYAGRADYFTQHGGASIYDYDTALANCDIPEGHYVWWGFEDSYLYQIAQKELTRLSAGEEPFALTMLTVDTHHVGGYVCDLCADEYENQTANVVRCADRQISAFLDWCKTQDFYQDTLIVVTGDHARMDSELVADVDLFDRTNYNLFLNVDASLAKTARVTDRVYTPMDLFPTIVSALGNQICGDRLGLGTDLFSDTPTLCEELGYAAFNAEISKYSQFYIDQFS